MGMSNKKFSRSLPRDTVSANECTGALSNVSTDPEEVARIHDEFVGRGK